MQIEEFLKILKKCKASCYYARIPDNGKVIHYTDSNTWKITISEDKCKCCGRSGNVSGIEVEFYEPLREENHITIFEAGMLFLVFYKSLRPTDYANFHKCVAGKRFIENIKKIEVLR